MLQSFLKLCRIILIIYSARHHHPHRPRLPLLPPPHRRRQARVRRPHRLRILLPLLNRLRQRLWKDTVLPSELSHRRIMLHRLSTGLNSFLTCLLWKISEFKICTLLHFFFPGIPPKSSNQRKQRPRRRRNRIPKCRTSATKRSNEWRSRFPVRWMKRRLGKITIENGRIRKNRAMGTASRSPCAYPPNK